MKILIAVYLVAAAVLHPGLVRAADAAFKGGPGDLEKAVDARASKLGSITPASRPLSQIAKILPRKGALVRVAFGDVGFISRGGGKTSFVGHHLSAGVYDFVLVTFPADVEITPHSSSIVVGSLAGTKEITAANGSKVTVPVIAARVVGVIDGATLSGGVPTFAPNSPIHIYERAAGKAAAKATTHP
ncbi:MAG: hypothetical protein ACHQ49_07140 [Elusimicrobiota bacterium]